MRMTLICVHCIAAKYSLEKEGFERLYVLTTVNIPLIVVNFFSVDISITACIYQGMATCKMKEIDLYIC